MPGTRMSIRGRAWVRNRSRRGDEAELAEPLVAVPHGAAAAAGDAERPRIGRTGPPHGRRSRAGRRRPRWARGSRTGRGRVRGGEGADAAAASATSAAASSAAGWAHSSRCRSATKQAAAWAPPGGVMRWSSAMAAAHPTRWWVQGGRSGVVEVGPREVERRGRGCRVRRGGRRRRRARAWWRARRGRRGCRRGRTGRSGRGRRSRGTARRRARGARVGVRPGAQGAHAPKAPRRCGQRVRPPARDVADDGGGARAWW